MINNCGNTRPWRGSCNLIPRVSLLPAKSDWKEMLLAGRRETQGTRLELVFSTAVCHSSNLFMNVPPAYCTWKNVVLTSSIFFVLFIVVTICAHPVGGKKCQNFRKIKKCDRCLNVFCCNRFSSTETGCKEIHCILNTKNYFSTSNNKGPHQNCTIEWLQGNCWLDQALW